MAGSREFFDDTILEFLGETSETSEASEDDIDTLFEALPLDWETTPPAQLRPYLQFESPPVFCTRYFARSGTPESKKRERKYCNVNWNMGEKIR